MAGSSSYLRVKQNLLDQRIIWVFYVPNEENLKFSHNKIMVGANYCLRERKQQFFGLG